MASSSRIQVGVLVTAVTLLVCSLGVRHELNSAKEPIAAHRLQTQRAHAVARSLDVGRDERRRDVPDR
jgi:hypothetical protein